MKKVKQTVRFVQIITAESKMKTEYGSWTSKPEIHGLDSCGRVWCLRTSVGSPQMATWFLTEFTEKRRFQFVEPEE